MHVQQLYTSCLSEAAYFIADGGEAALIDPLRDVDEYLKMAQEQGVKIKYIFETHFHADFVSGHLELHQKTGAPIVFGPQTVAGFDFRMAADGEIFTIGSLKIQAIHTPGHTMESTSYLLYNEAGKPYCIFTGDTLFVGDVGRPDLFSGDRSREELAGILYDSLQEKIKTLPDDVLVYPAHGPGSACGKALGKETFSTIGTQKQTNYALQEMTKADFIKAVTEGLSAPPVYFGENARINRQGYKQMEELKTEGLRALSVEEFKAKTANDAWIIDTRPSTVFTQGFVPDSISIGLDGRAAEWAGNLIPFSQPVVLVTEPGREEESLVRLARVGFENVGGYLKGGYDAWVEAGSQPDLIIDIEPDELAMDLPYDSRMEVVDVRKPSEFEAGHVKGATNVPLDTMADVLNIAMLDSDHSLYVHCAGGYRSVIACSLLKRQGYHNVRNVLGGWSRIKEEKNMPIVEPKAQRA